MEKDAGITLAELRVDGGATANNLLMQFQADLLGVPVVRPKVARDDGAGRRVPRGARGRLLDVRGRREGELADRPHLRARDVARPGGEPARAVEPRGGAREGLGAGVRRVRRGPLARLAAAAAAARPFGAIDALVDDWQARHAVSGAIVVQRGEETLYARASGWADPARGRPFLVDTPSDSASLAKPFTALVVLLLARERLLDLDAPVTRYVAEFPHADTRLRHLLAHAAGLPDYDAFAALFSAGSPVTTSAMLRAIGESGTPPAFAPGTRFAYCNLCLDTLALVAERASGRRFDALLRERIWAPAGVEDASLRPARVADFPAHYAVGHRRRNGSYEPYGAEELEAFHGASNHYVSSRAMARLGAGFAGGAPWVGAAGRDATARVRLADGTTTGITLGNWYCDASHQRCYYNGHHRGFDTLLYWDAQRALAIAWVANSALPVPLPHVLTRALVAAAEGRTASVTPAPLADLDESVLARLVGDHDVPGVGRVRVAFDPRRGTLRSPEGVVYETIRVSRALY